MTSSIQLETSLRRCTAELAVGTGHGQSLRRRRAFYPALQRWCALFVALLIQTACASAADTIPLEVNGQTLRVELAVTPAQQARGLMYRKSMPDDHGMLFVYDEAQEVSYWMKNTFIPLSIAFIDGDKRIVNMADMAPNNSVRTYPSRGPIRYVLEVNQSWFAEHGVKEGDVVKFQLQEKSR